jgi:hypothetical protein
LNYKRNCLGNTGNITKCSANGELPFEYKARWAPEPVSVFWRRDKSLTPARIPWFLRHPAHSIVILRQIFGRYNVRKRDHENYLRRVRNGGL